MTLPDTLSASRVLLDGTYYPISGPVQPQLVSGFVTKVNFGDSGRDNEPLRSSWVMSEWTGGMLVLRGDPSKDADRFWYSTCDTRWFRALTLPPLATLSNGGMSAGERLQQVITYNNQTYCISSGGSGPRIGHWVPGSASWAWDFNIPGSPTDMITYVDITASWLLVGHSAGYVKYDGTTFTNVPFSGTAQPIVFRFVKYNNNVWAMNGFGRLWQCTAMNTNTWVLYTAVFPGISASPSPARQLVVYPNQFGEGVIYAIAAEGAWMWDPVATQWMDTSAEWPYWMSGIRDTGVAKYHGDIYISLRQGLLRFTGTSLINIGLDRDDGLGAEIASTINFVANGWNYLVVATLTDVYVWTGSAWHLLWYGPNRETIECCGITRIDSAGTTNVWIATAAGNTYALPLPQTIFNPKTSTNTTYATSGVHITSWFDAAYHELSKLAIDVTAEGTAISATENVLIEYQIDNGDDTSGWTSLGRMTSNGPTTYPFGNGPGSTFKRIRFRYTLVRGSTTTAAPLLYYATLTFIKRLRTLYGYSFQIDLSTAASDEGRQPEELLALLDASVRSQTLLRCQFERSGLEWGNLTGNLTGAAERYVIITHFAAIKFGDDWKVNLAISEV